MVHRWVEWVREFVTQRAQRLREGRLATERTDSTSVDPDSVAPSSDLQPSTSEEGVMAVASGGEISRRSDSYQGGESRGVVKCPAIVHGEPLTDRKSTFQAHAAAVTSVAEVRGRCMCVLS